MKIVFADTVYWAAMLNPRDQWHRTVKETRARLGQIRLVTTETVMIELLNYFCEFGDEMRQTVADTVRDVMIDPEIRFIPDSSEIFLDALDFYQRRPDKGFSLTDCVSMLTMTQLDIREALTHDNHFVQEGLTVLF